MPPHAISWQITLIGRLIRQGLPIEGLTIGAGVPSLDIATQYIGGLGLKHISFKPGSVEAISDVIAISKSSPLFPVILQYVKSGPKLSISWEGELLGSFRELAPPISSKIHTDLSIDGPVEEEAAIALLRSFISLC